MIHNETVNVWSHLIGVLVFIGLIVYTALWRAHPGQGSQAEVMRQRLMDADMVRGLMHQGYTFDQIISDSLSWSAPDNLSPSPMYYYPPTGDDGQEAAATLFETLEHEISHALHLLADPSAYVR
jgi:hypothetical protein